MPTTKRVFKRNTLVYHREGDHFPVYVIMSELNGKYALALPWEPEVLVFAGVDSSSLEPVFERQLKLVR